MEMLNYGQLTLGSSLLLLSCLVGIIPETPESRILGRETATCMMMQEVDTAIH